ncbi:MAG: hypothetical protein ACREDT_15045 [Methylocella sp.]
MAITRVYRDAMIYRRDVSSFSDANPDRRAGGLTGKLGDIDDRGARLEDEI